MSEYRKFLESEYANRKLSTYEKICKFFDRLKLKLPKNLEKRIQEEIDFCHLRVTPKGVVLTAIFIPVIVFLILSGIFYVFGIYSLGMILMLILLSTIIFYYLFYYTSFLVKYFRASAAAEMTSAIIYMAISMDIEPNLENAVAFAAQNLTGTLGLDFKKILWDLQTGRLISVVSGLDELAEKWKKENEEFVDALALLKSSINQPSSKISSTINEAINLMIEGTKARMKQYALTLRSPLKILNAFGILMPMLSLIFFPVLVIFIPEIAKAELLAFSYTILLPIIVYIFMRQYFYARPYSYHRVETENLEQFKKSKKLFFLIFLILGTTLSSFLMLNLLSSETIFSFEQFLYSFLLIVVLSSSISLYSFLSTFRYLKFNQEILAMEDELPVVLFQLSVSLGSGKPIEKNIEEILPKIKTLKIKKLFENILSNITVYGMSFESAVLKERIGAIHSCPSKLISMSMRLMVDISKRGMYFLAKSLKSISKFLSDANEVNKATEEILSETISDMQLQAWVFAPLSAGVVVGLMSIIIYIFSFFGQSFQNIETFFTKSGLGEAGLSTFSFLLNIGKQVPFHIFQLIVGVYMIEMVVLISMFLGEMKYGEDEINKIFQLGKILLLATAIYSIVVLSLYFGITSFIQLPSEI